MARTPGTSPSKGAKPPAKAGAAAAPETPKKPFNVIQFARDVRAEARKVTWTSRQETWITSVMVGMMVIVASLFFFLVDAVFSFGISQALKLGNLGS